MNDMKEQQPGKEFARRTFENLKTVIKDAIKNKNIHERYEVTQIINSFLGLLVFPKQEWMSKSENRSLFNDFPNKRIGEIYKNQKKKKISEDFFAMLRHMRNAVAHNGIEFQPGEDNQIQSIEFTDKSGGSFMLKIEDIIIILTDILRKMNSDVSFECVDELYKDMTELGYECNF